MQGESSSPKMQKVALCLVQHPVVRFAWPPEVSRSSPSKRQALLLRHLPQAAVLGSSLSCWSALWLGVLACPSGPVMGKGAPCHSAKCPWHWTCVGRRSHRAGGAAVLTARAGLWRGQPTWDCLHCDLGRKSSDLELCFLSCLISLLDIQCEKWWIAIYSNNCNIGECSY